MHSLSRRGFVRAGALAAVPSAWPVWSVWPAGPAAEAASAGARRPFLPYGRSSYFRSTVEHASIDRQRTDAFRAFMRHHPEQTFDHPRINGVGGNQWGTAYAMGRL